LSHPHKALRDNFEFNIYQLDSITIRFTIVMASERFVTTSVFVGQIICFAVMFSFFKFISQTCVDVLPGQSADTANCPPGQTKFARPMLNAFMMVASMSLGFIYYFPFRHGKPGIPKITRKSMLYILLPSLLDCCCSLLLLAGSIFIPMSLALVLKGTRIFFSCLLAILLFKRKIKAYQWTGVVLALIGSGLAGLSAILNNSNTPSTTPTSKIILGICLVIAGEFVRSLMVTIQEMQMKKGLCDPVFLMSLQGVYGGFFIFIAMVIAWKAVSGNDIDGSFESLAVTFQMASQSTTIITMLCLVPLFSVTGFICSAFVSKLLSAVHNAMASVMMTAVVWLFEIIVRYAIDDHLGSAWGPYSALQLVGFGFVVVAMIVYGPVVKFPKVFEYPTESKAELETKEELRPYESQESIELTK
jgi:drug/metabolite transporter (DMT)-like permease